MGISNLAPNATALAAEIDRESKNNPEMRGQFDSLKQTLDHHTSGMNMMMNMGGIAQFERLLKNDPAFKDNVRQLALQNPAALEQIVPAMLKKPGEMQQLVTATANANTPQQPQATATAPQTAAPAPSAAPQRSAPTIVSAVAPQAQPDPAPADAAPAAEAPQAAASAPAAAAPAAEISPLDILAGKTAQLAEIPGYGDLMERVANNPQLTDMFAGMAPADGDATDAIAVVDQILGRAGSTPEERAESTLFTDLVKTIDEKPGMVSSIAANFSNDPKTGMMMVGMYSQFNQGFGKFLGDFIGADFMDGILNSLMTYIGKMIGQSSALMNMSNNNGSLLGGLMNTLGVNNATPVSAVSPENGEVTTQTAEAYQANAAAATPEAAALRQQREMEEREQAQRLAQNGQNPEQNPGQSPQGPAPAFS